MRSRKRHAAALRRRGRTGIGACLLASALIVSGCAVGPDRGPDLVPGGGGADGPAPSSSTPRPAPVLSAPADDLAWRDCAAESADRFGVPAPTGVQIGCAEFDSPVDPDRPDAEVLSIAATRAALPETPADAAPLVLTTGSDMPSSRVLLLLAAGPGRDLLRSHPVVAVDRRGLPEGTELDCMTRVERSTIADNGLTSPAATPDERINRLAAAASSAADGCNETLTPYQLNFGIGFAAADLEALRQRWDVDALGLIGVGEGAEVALAYSALYGGRAGRMILDTPTPFGASARDRAQAQAGGVQRALQTFTQRCTTIAGCELGPNGMATMSSVIAKARTGRVGELSDTQVLAAITTAVALAADRPEALSAVAAAITAADRGQPAALTSLAIEAAELRLTDGALVSRCNDTTGPVGQNEVPGLIDAWSRQNPLTGTNSALSLLRCNGWAAGQPVNPPNSLPADPLILNGANDPINGDDGATALTPIFINAAATPVTVSWDGLGYSVLARSACAAGVVAEYVERTPLGGPTQRACPA